MPLGRGRGGRLRGWERKEAGAGGRGEWGERGGEVQERKGEVEWEGKEDEGRGVIGGGEMGEGGRGEAEERGEWEEGCPEGVVGCVEGKTIGLKRWGRV